MVPGCDSSYLLINSGRNEGLHMKISVWKRQHWGHWKCAGGCPWSSMSRESDGTQVCGLRLESCSQDPPVEDDFWSQILTLWITETYARNIIKLTQVQLVFCVYLLVLMQIKYFLGKKRWVCTEHAQVFWSLIPYITQCSHHLHRICTVLGLLSNQEMTWSIQEDVCRLYANTISYY